MNDQENATTATFETIRLQLQEQVRKLRRIHDRLIQVNMTIDEDLNARNRVAEPQTNKAEVTIANLRKDMNTSTMQSGGLLNEIDKQIEVLFQKLVNPMEVAKSAISN